MTATSEQSKLQIWLLCLGLQLLMEAIKKAGYEGKIKIGMDVAASEFHKSGKYDLDFKNDKSDASKYVSTMFLMFKCLQ